MLERVLLAEDDPNAVRLKEIAIGLRVEGEILHSYGEPVLNSPFAEANDHYPWEKASDWCREYLSAALESALLWADFYMPLSFGPEAKIDIRPRPVQGLARSALESASQAAWVMTGDTPEELSLRHLRLMYMDFDEQRKAYRLQGDRVDAARAQLATFVERLAGRFDLDDVKKSIRYMDTIRVAAQLNGIDPDEAEFVWRLATGSTHGKRWAALELNDIELIEEYEYGQFRSSRTPRLDFMVRALGIAYDVLAYSVAVYGARCGARVEDMLKAKREGFIKVAKQLPIDPDREGERTALLEQLGKGQGSSASLRACAAARRPPRWSAARRAGWGRGGGTRSWSAPACRGWSYPQRRITAAEWPSTLICRSAVRTCSAASDGPNSRRSSMSTPELRTLTRVTPVITGELKGKIDRVWDAFWSGGISNPLEVIEQITYLLFIRRLDDIQTLAEKKARITKTDVASPVFLPGQAHLRWSQFKNASPEVMHQTIADEVFPFLRSLGAAPDRGT
ncbi:MAG: type I restriction-modification system subunit M N-terminal domain-containing protein [Micrococcales bacterium]|nr:type I restriction-modification system subunit M N-terminal domain-containing protein [Micrococcales bacterium]